jgi:hypothetical protein
MGSHCVTFGMAHGYDIVYHLFIPFMIGPICQKGIKRPFDTSPKIMGPIDDWMSDKTNQTVFHVRLRNVSVLIDRESGISALRPLRYEADVALTTTKLTN